MKCLSDDKIIAYTENELNSVDSSLIRDHLIVCKKCSEKYALYMEMNNALNEPFLLNPPEQIEKTVINKITKGYSYFGSIVSLILASFLMLITGIYIYFNFANDSIIQALKATSKKTSTLISTFVNFVETVFIGINTVFKALNSLIEAVLNIHLGAGVTGLIFTSIFIFLLFIIFKRIQASLKSER